MADEEPQAVVARIVPLHDTDQPDFYGIVCPECQTKAVAHRQEGYTGLECPTCGLAMKWMPHCLVVKYGNDPVRETPRSA